MTLMVIVGIAFLIFCVVSVLIITALIQPPTKAIDYYLETRGGKPAGGAGKATKGFVPGAEETQPSAGEPADTRTK